MTPTIILNNPVQDAVASNTVLQCSGTLCGADWKSVNDNSAQPFGPIIKGQR